MIDAMLLLTGGIGFDEAIKIEDGDELIVAILKSDGTNIQLLRLSHVSIEDDGSRSVCEPAFIRVMVDVAKGGRFETEETKRKAAIEEEREACAKILDAEEEYYRLMKSETPELAYVAFHHTAAKVAAHLARKIRARGGE